MKTTQAHTPGPWRRGQEGNLRVYGPDGEGQHSGLVANVFKSGADAALIAAAPDLLAVLKAIVTALQIDAPGTPLNNRKYDQMAHDARAAIAKAEGTTGHE